MIETSLFLGGAKNLKGAPSRDRSGLEMSKMCTVLVTFAGFLLLFCQYLCYKITFFSSKNRLDHDALYTPARTRKLHS